MISIPFQRVDGQLTFSDALVLPDDHTFTDAELEAMMQQRFDNWLAVIHAPEVPVDPALGV